MATFDAKRAVTDLLRPSERAILVVDTSPDGGTSGNPRSSPWQTTRRVLAIVLHESHEQKHGALFVYKCTRRDPPSLALVDSLAISPLMAISVVRLTSSGSALSNDGDKQSAPTRSDCLVDIRSDGKELSLICDETSALALERETTDLKKYEVMDDESSERTHSWMTIYSHDGGERKIISQLRRPQDLRHLYHGPALSLAFAGDPGDEEGDMMLIRDQWIRNRVRNRWEEYSTSHNVRLRIGTFNVNGKTPTSSIRSWVCSTLEKSEDPDVLVFGFQELDLSAGALLYTTSTALEDTWTTAILEGLGAKAGSYVKFASRQLVGILIIGLVRKGQRPYISEIATSSIGVGLMGIMGNKGGVGLRFRFRDTVICCVTSHLAADEGMMEKRNSDYLEICHRLQFPLNAATPADAARQVQSISATMFESDVLIWMGDLNYRVDLAEDEVVELIGDPMKPYNIDTLMEYDELLISRREKLAFELFLEDPVSFVPTYRYYVNTPSFDPRRRPAWTDRILHIAYPQSCLRQISYQSHPDIILSDHRPVSADFALEIRSTDPFLHSKTIADVLKSTKNSTIDEKSRPRIHLSSQQINIGDVRYRQPVVRTVELTNTGSRPCAFRFISQEGAEPIAPSWLSVDVQHGFLLPQESIAISLTVKIADSLVATLNQGSRDLDAVLIIHPEHGADMFIAVSGHFLPTCFARSLDSLVHLPSPVRSSDGIPVLDDAHAANNPKELMRIIDWLMTNPLLEQFKELFLAKSPPEILHCIYEALDTGEEFQFNGTPSWTPSMITLAFGEVLLQFLASLTEPVVPVESHSRIASGQEEDMEDFLDTMSHVAVNVWLTLFAFLQYECVRTEDHLPRLDRADRIAAVFAPVLIRDVSENELISPLTPLQKRRFVMRFLM